MQFWWKDMLFRKNDSSQPFKIFSPLIKWSIWSNFKDLQLLKLWWAFRRNQWLRKTTLSLFHRFCKKQSEKRKTRTRNNKWNIFCKRGLQSVNEHSLAIWWSRKLRSMKILWSLWILIIPIYAKRENLHIQMETVNFWC